MLRATAPMNLFAKFFLICIISLFLSACATLTSDIEVETHANPDVDFSSYKTYAWAGSAQIVFDPIGQWGRYRYDSQWREWLC